uniref:Acetolactate synthase n=1 Tax=Triparma laevis TaxID=1534972 RepID=A0A0K2RW57_9STRA|nr:acetohydroxyacid synthetase large subunit [Triparma laevis]BAS19049.1 acetohydroxyacid synthetase large subunit [Triparma laevis]
MVFKTKISNKQTGAFALIDSLVRNGAEDIFGYPGGAILPIYDELYFWEQQGLIRHILTRHEQGAIHAADAYARVTGRVGVCFATSGPGATNLVTGIANAQLDSVPLVVITGQVGRAFIGTDAFQETDIFGITLPIVKHSYVIRDPKQMNRIVSEAFYIAQNGRPGPVLIDIPKDVGLEEFTNYLPVQQKEILKTKGYRFQFKTTNKQIFDALKMIRQASQPLLYVGGGAVISNSHQELLKLAELFSIPVTTTLMGKGSFNEKHSLSLGMLGMHGTAYANFAVSECDLLIAVGTRFDDRVTGKLDEFACHAQVLHLDIDPAEVGKNRLPQLALVGDVKQILSELLKISDNDSNYQFDSIQTEAWLQRIQKWRQTYPLMISQIKNKLSPQQVINSVGNSYPNAIFTTDVGQHQMWSAQFIKCGPRKWASSAGLGTMGYGLPAAIGAQVAFPKSPVVCISGDSSIQMCIQELGTIVQYNLPIRLVIVNNHWQGMVRQWQESFYGERYSHSNMEAGQPNFVNLAKSYGIKAYDISNETEMETILLESKDYKGPIVFNFAVVEDENCYPMVAPGKSNSQMMGITKQNKIVVKQTN